MRNDDAKTLRWQRRAVGVYFWIVGVIVGAWVARLPEIQHRLALDDGRLGLVLLMSAAGALVAMPLTGRLAPRVGARRLAWGSAGSTCLLLPGIAGAPTVAGLMAVLGAFGASTGVHGVVLNALAVDLEERTGEPILSRFHGLFSLGGLTGSIIAAGCLAWPVGPVPSLVGAAVGVGLINLAAGPWLPPVRMGSRAGRGGAIANHPGGSPDGRAGSRAWRHLIALGGLAFLGLMGEGAMGDWSAVYLRRSLGAAPALAGLGYAAYSLGMTAGRFSGDFLTRRAGDVALIRAGSSLAALGLWLAVAVADPRPAIVGLTLVGAGLANAVPVLYRAAARTSGVQPVAGIATTSTVGYLGFLAGPPLIGMIAWSTSLATGLAVVAGGLAIVALAGGIVGSSGLQSATGGATVPLDPGANADRRTLAADASLPTMSEA